MIRSVAAEHQTEVSRGERFQFGKNWADFLRTVNDEKISLAERSLQTALDSKRLDRRTFLDVGSGSGLFSLAARRLGAVVHSFDYDPASVACTSELKQRFFPKDDGWIIEQGSVLDRAYLSTLGTFDIVYSWGVLHHTGAMWEALENVKPMVKENGQLYIAIYNDLGAETDRWRAIKKTYNKLPTFLQLPFALAIIARHDAQAIRSHLRERTLGDYWRRWTQYHQTARGMNQWYDWIDWIGGYPYECATLEELVDFFGKDGFSLEWLESRTRGTGCNETVFRRKADLGVFIDNPLPKSRFLLRRYGSGVVGSPRATTDGYVGRVPDRFADRAVSGLLLFRDGKLAGSAGAGREPGTVIIAPSDWSEERIAATRFELVPGRIKALTAPFRKYQGHMVGYELVELRHVADNTTPTCDNSPVYVFEDKQQLSFPNSIHADIVRHGAGRFSHWGNELLFSSTDNSDPHSNGRVYEIAIAEPENVKAGSP